MLESVIKVRNKVDKPNVFIGGFSGVLLSLSEEDVENLIKVSEIISEASLEHDNSAILPDEFSKYIKKDIRVVIHTGTIPYFETFDKFLSGNLFELNISGHYIHDIDYNDNIKEPNLDYSKYKSTIDLIELLRLTADHDKHNENTIELFYHKSDNGAVLNINYTSSDLKNISAESLEELKIHFIEKVDKQERIQIFKNEIINLINRKNTYSYLLKNFDLLIANYQKSYELYLEGFSFEKIITASDEHFHKLSDKIQDTIGKVSNYIFAIPIAYILLLRYFEFDGSNFLGDSLLLAIGFIFLILIWLIPFANISESITSIRGDLESIRSKIEKVSSLDLVIEKLNNHSTKLDKQGQKLVVAKIAAISIFVVILIAYLSIHCSKFFALCFDKVLDCIELIINILKISFQSF